MTFSRVFSIFLNATALWAFAALVATGQLHFSAVIVSLPLMTLPMFGFSRRVRLSTHVWTFLTVLAFITALLNIFVMREVMYSIVYFFLFLEITKLWTVTKNRDVFQVLVLSFFQMVAAAVMTASLSYAFLFIGYVFLVTVTWMLFSIKKEADGIDQGDWRRRDRRKRTVRSPLPYVAAVSGTGGTLSRWRAVNSRFLSGAAGITVSVLVGTALIFLLIPRFSAQKFLSGLGLLRAQRVSGFSEQIAFEDIGEIQLDPTVIARVQVTPLGGSMPTLPDHLRLRITSLDSYDGTRWRKGRDINDRLIPYSSAHFNVRETSPAGWKLRQDIILEPSVTTYFFGATMPYSYSFHYAMPLAFDPYNFSVRSLRDSETSIRYIVDSEIPMPLEEEAEPEQEEAVVTRLATGLLHAGTVPLRVATRIASTRDWRRIVDGQTEPEASDSQGLRLPEVLQRRFTGLPEVGDMETVSRLAREWTGGSRSPLRICKNIEAKLQSEFTYTTDVRVKNPDTPMTEFLTETRAGHCEFFASAMTLMLRTLRIPARIVTGYYTDDYNAAGGYFMVRRQHAHSWVEAWIEPYGWVVFDPSPAAGVGANRIPSRFFSGVQKYIDALRFYWYRHVIDFDISDQMRFARSTTRFRSQVSESLNQFLEPVGGLLTLFTRDSRGISPPRVFLVMIFLAIGGFLAWLLARELLPTRNRRAGTTVSTRQHTLTRQIAYYLELLQTLAALNYRRQPGQTPLEFAREVITQRNEWQDLLPVTEAYYQARFRAVEIEPTDLERARLLIQQIRSRPTPAPQASA